ncbi:MAG: ACT domain-containing protein [Clostridiales bacterium]|jgi:hypothetical protein|nr:ACT domain-containing protein [Clostridiales bacterium]
MFLKQLSIFVENRLGAIAEATEVLAANNINIRALTTADTTDFGILRLIVDKPELAAKKLRENSIIVNVSNVIGIKLDDTPGSFHKVLKILSESGIAVEYSYAFVSPFAGSANIILRVQDEHTALRVLTDNNIKFIEEVN